MSTPKASFASSLRSSFLDAARAVGSVILVGAALGACATPAADDASFGGEDEIVGGVEDARFAPVGYLALEHDRTGTRFTPFCTATLIAPKVVVTAAHCVHEIKHSVRNEGPYMTFSPGATDAEERSPAFVRLIYEDPGFDPTDPRYFEREGYAYDFALLVLENAPEGIKPARIVERGDPAREHLAIGYGRTKTGPFDLVEEGLPKRKSLPMKLVGGSPTTHYLADPEGGAVCYGDSGGPLLELGSAGPRGAAIVGVLATMFTTDPNLTCVPGTRTAYASLTAKKALVDEVLAAAERTE